MGYSTQQSVLAKAGLWFQEIGETPAGSANGSNTVFTVDHKPLADRDYSDTVTKDDVVAYVDGTPVTVSSINATTGAVTLSAAPSNGTAVTIDYAYSSVSQTDVSQAIEEADEWIDTELADVLSASARTTSKTVRKLSRLYAAGLLMTGEYALQQNEEQVTAGQAYIKLARSMMKEYRDRLISNGDATEAATPVVTTKQRLYQKYDESTGRWNPLSDEQFTVNRES